MSIPIVICDDSSFARKQVARSLPKGWDVTITFAENGQEGVEALRAGKGDILFLDLTMPVLDGFGVLEKIRDEDLPTLPIVISGDIQPESQERVKRLGAIAFIKKPVKAEELIPVLEAYGLLELLDTTRMQQVDHNIDFRDWCQENANVAMGRAAELLAKFIDDSVELSIPKVRLLTPEQLNGVLVSSNSRGVSHVSQGFTGSGIFGETIIVFHDVDFEKLAQSMHYMEAVNRESEVELLMDLANILVGTFLKGISDLLHINFSRGHPHLTLHMQFDEPLVSTLDPRDQILSIELSYAIGKNRVNCDQLLLFPPVAVANLEQYVGYIVG